MPDLKSLFDSAATVLPLGFALLLVFILVVSFRSRPVVFCQYLRKMTGVELNPVEVKRVFAEKGKDGVRDLFLELIIQEDLKKGSLQIPTGPAAGRDAPDRA